MDGFGNGSKSLALLVGTYVLRVAKKARKKDLVEELGDAIKKIEEVDLPARYLFRIGAFGQGQLPRALVERVERGNFVA